LTLARLLLPGVFFLGFFCANHSAVEAQSTGSPLTGWAGDGAALRAIQAATFRFNDRYTTPFGPAYADIWLVQSDFLACRPPVGRPFSYALCYFSGPAIGTPVPADGTASVNPPLPCILSPDGKSANCTCYEINTEQYSPYVPYFVSINAILNLNLYLRTIAACGHDGELCSPQPPTRDSTWWNPAPVCRAANTNSVIPGAELISVFSTLKNSDYETGTSPNSTTCAAGKYAGCMTAPCRHTGRQDNAGNNLVECTCPIYDGPFELGQAGVPCDANELTPTGTARCVTRGLAALRNSLARGRTRAEHLIRPRSRRPYGSGCRSRQGRGLHCKNFSPTPARAAALEQFYALIDTAYARLGAPPVYVWSAAHNPRKNHEPIDPPAAGCLPDVAGDRAARSILRPLNIRSPKAIRSA
jgi:hypothetical protein